MPDDNNSTDTNNQNNTNNQGTDNNQNQANNKNKEIVLGCDNNGNNKECQDFVGKAIEKAGYKVHYLEIAPGPFANYSYRSEAKGKIGVYLMAGSLVSYLDGADANFDYNVFGIRGDISESLGTKEGFAKNKVPPDHDGCAHPKCGEYGNKYTYPELNEMYKGKCVAVPGATFEELAQNIIQALGGQYAGAGGSSGGGAQIKDKTFEHCIRRICAATDSVFIVENNAAVLFPYTDWMAFTLRRKINQIKAKDMDPDLFSIEYNNEGFYNKVTTVYGADEEEDGETTNDSAKNKANNKTNNKIKNDKQNEVEKTQNGKTTKTRKTMPTGGTQLSEQYDPLVKIYGELEKKVTTNFPDEETAQYVTNALLIQYIRDFNNSCRVRVLNNRKFMGGTFYAVENPNTKKSELFYLNSYTLFKSKKQPLVADIQFKYGPEGAEEVLDYQTFGGGGGGTDTGPASSTEDAIWKNAAKFKYCHCNSTEDPQQAWSMFGGKEDKSSTDCYGMSAYLYYCFNTQAKIPCRVVGNSDHHVVMLYKNNAWQETRDQYRSYNLAYNFKWRGDQDTTVLLEAPNAPAGSSTASNPSGNTANQQNK